MDRLERERHRAVMEDLRAEPRKSHRQRQQHRIHRLGEEQVGHPLDISDHTPPLGNYIGQGGELVVQQHNLRHRAGGRTTRSHRDTDISVLEGQHIVDAIAGHRDRVPVRLQRLDHRPLLVGAHPAEGGRVGQRGGQLVGVGWQCAGVHRGARQPQRLGHRTHRHRVVTRNHLDRDMLGSKVVQRLASVGPDLLLQHHQRPGSHRTGCMRVVNGQFGRGQQQHSQAPRPDLLGGGGNGVGRIQQHIRRTDHPVAMLPIRSATPLLGRRKWGYRSRFPPRRGVISLGDGSDAGVGPGIVGSQLRQHRQRVLVAVTVGEVHVCQAHPVLGEGPGLVGAHRIDPGQPLDSRQLLHQALAPPQPNHADRKGDRRHQHQALGHHRDERAHHAQHRFLPAVIGGEQLGVNDQRARRQQQIGDELQNLVDTVAQLGVHQGELGGFLGELGRVGLPPHFGGPVRTAAGHHEATRKHLRTNGLLDGIGLAGQQ
ncbi:Uncharacterised protein [Mycobacteroides abscessus subsp. abscessus]|nr:Uncharacterised protein [Mycobacteroides abscessus subsp. abscessus]SIC25345.1 Uncharacterised protein [Mycobacteroides abscessus subsp. abscessus]SKO74825.1 Uncharacterised protein [Mycobacteroides abscessus subsp. abscessus]SKS60927.1 Uncharacterised protein [Mycobacteroides abscessus subsp. abscessus]SKY68931.1 Uncharacterised protein [Mycobacteroides abscessus subsp. abscessus]